LPRPSLAPTRLAHTRLAHTRLAHTRLAHTRLAHTRLAHTRLAHTRLAPIQSCHQVTRILHTLLVLPLLLTVHRHPAAKPDCCPDGE
jgi:hypothetical protein